MKTFVFRSKVCTSSSVSPLKFGDDNEVVIPMVVYEKLNTPSIPVERRKNANGLLNYISSLTGDNIEAVKKLHDINYGLKQKNGSKLYILDAGKTSKEINPLIKNMTDLSEYDKRIFQLCFDLSDHGKDVHLISKNAVIRQKAMLLGIIAEPFKDELAPALSEQYTGRGGKILTSETSFQNLVSGSCDEGISINSLIEPPKVEPVENMFYILSTPNNEITKKHTIVRYTNGNLVPLKYYKQFCPSGYTAANDEQKMMMECLLAPPEIAPLVIIKGSAGSGKTFGAVSAALQNLENYSDEELNIGHYKTFRVSAPVVEMTKDQKMGYLPGDVEDKFGPYTGGFIDNISHYFENKNPEAPNLEIEGCINELFSRLLIKLEPANFLRGRSIEYSFFMLDEAQNFHPYIIPHIVTRAGKTTKIVLMGDPSQISALDLSERFNGVVYASESMKGSPLAWQVTLSKSVRSPLASEAIKRMKY